MGNLGKLSQGAKPFSQDRISQGRVQKYNGFRDISQRALNTFSQGREVFFENQISLFQVYFLTARRRFRVI